MARALRVAVAGGWYHVVNRGHRRERIFLTDEDRRAFLGRLADFGKRFHVEVHAFVLMDNHYHLLVRPASDNLSRAIQWLQLTHSVRFNWANRTSGHVFQGRFKAIHVQEEGKAAEVARYLHLNPVRIGGLGLSKTDQRRAKVADLPDPGAELIRRRVQTLDGHRWSSWQVYAGREAAPGWLETRWIQRANGGRNRKEWLAAVREYTEAPIRQGRLESPWIGVVGGAVLGEVEYAKGLLAKAKVDVDEQTDARVLVRAGRISWERLVAVAEAERGVKWEDALERHGDWTRDVVLYLAVREAGYGLSEVFRRIPNLKYQAAAQGVKRIEARRARDPECDALIRRAGRRLSKI
ncbi:MAG: transposase [Verrucomicrobiales bacterium]|nr:transposase [Verrucomicrobiales bacterium]